jgi:hypothetical protein
MQELVASKKKLLSKTFLLEIIDPVEKVFLKGVTFFTNHQTLWKGKILDFQANKKKQAQLILSVFSFCEYSVLLKFFMIAQKPKLLRQKRP